VSILVINVISHIITLFLILSLLSSTSFMALTSEPIHLTFGQETDNSDPGDSNDNKQVDTSSTPTSDDTSSTHSKSSTPTSDDTSSTHSKSSNHSKSSTLTSNLSTVRSNQTNQNLLLQNLVQYQGNTTAKYIILLDIKQTCIIAGSFNCVAQQNQFATSSLITTYDSLNKTWAISGTVKDTSKSQLNNTQVTALFYDGKGNAININPITSSITPNTINPSEDGTFTFNVSVNNDLSGSNPLYMVLVYSQQQQNLNTNSGPIQSPGQQQEGF
jgi:hypothetical protein